jgi:putative transposase
MWHMKNGRMVGSGVSYYHCMSRIVGGERLLGDGEKEAWRTMLWRVAEFSGVRVVTYAVMSNHFHVLVRVPGREEAKGCGDDELVKRYAALYGESRSAWHPKPEVLAELLRKDEAEGKVWRRRLLARMGDVSAFMKTLKQRFSHWYNQTHGRFGTLWAERFKSVWVEGSPRALMTVAAYIDLNPVRAGLSEDPAAYRWCGYAEAMGGKERAREGLSWVFGETREGWSDTARRYRVFLFGRGEGGRTEVGKIPRERVLEVVRGGGSVTRAEALRCRVRYFTDGAVLGSREFVERCLEEVGGGPTRRRKHEPRPMEGAEWGGLSVLRKLHREVFE